MANIEGMKMKYVVAKIDDVNKYCSPLGRNRLVASMMEIRSGRTAENKKENNYLVINTDESYAEEVIEIMKRHGHWG
jgi:hypothetical protein